jgi:small subunit ribosomal protein S1
MVACEVCGGTSRGIPSGETLNSMSESTNPKIDLDAKLEAEINEAMEEMDFESAFDHAAPPEELEFPDDVDAEAPEEQSGEHTSEAAQPRSAPGSSASSHDEQQASEAPRARANQDASATRPKRPRAQGTSSRPRRGVRLRTHAGSVMAIRGDDVLIELGPRSQGVCPISQFAEPPAVGSEHQFLIERVDPKDNVLILSLPGAVRKADWGTLDIGQTVEARCVGVIRGGLEMEVAGHKGFMPASHADIRHVKDVSVFLNEKMSCEVIQLDRRRGRMVLSRRKVLSRERKQKQRELIESLEPGATVTATIVSLQPYGAFADIGGIDGLIHVSDLSHDRIQHPSAVVKVGDEVQAKVLKVDTSQRPPKVSLGLKQLQTDPFEARLEEIKEGETISGRVTKLADFGAFVEVAPGIEGLVHISEIAWERIKTPGQILSQNQVISVKVLSVNKDERRISLSVKQTQERPAQPEHAPGSSGTPGSAGSPGPGGRGSGGGYGGGRGRGSNMFRGRDDQAGGNMQREVDPHLKKLRAALSKKFGDNLKGGIG